MAPERDNLPGATSVWVSSLLPRSQRPRVEAIVEAIRAGRWDEGSGYAKREGGRWVWVGALTLGDGATERVAIKARPASRFGLTPDRHVFKQSMGARRLRAASIPTSDPVAVLDVNLAGGGRERWFVLTALPGESLAHALAHKQSLCELASLARGAGSLVRALTDAGLFNRDHKASNLIVLPDGSIGVVDTVAIRRRRGDAASRRRMLLAMAKELRGIGAMPSLTHCLRCLLAASDEPRSDWRAVEAMLIDAGDTTPRVDPVRRGR